MNRARTFGVKRLVVRIEEPPFLPTNEILARHVENLENRGLTDRETVLRLKLQCSPSGYPPGTKKREALNPRAFFSAIKFSGVVPPISAALGLRGFLRLGQAPPRVDQIPVHFWANTGPRRPFWAAGLDQVIDGGSTRGNTGVV